jgi:dihydroxyacetone kinase-like protein
MSDSWDAARVRAWLAAFVKEFGDRRAELTELDRVAGDGDFGINLIGPLERARDAAASEDSVDVGPVFRAVADALMRAGGTSGPLFGVFFAALGREGAARTRLETGILARGVASGVAGVRRLGGAEVGDRTMIDALAPASDALADAAARADDLDAALAAAATAARRGAEATAGLVARKGRASYVGAAARGAPDPGAVTVAIFFETARAGTTRDHTE